MAVNIGPKIGIDGEAEYRKEINRLIQQSKTLASEMRLVTESFDENATAQERATAKKEVLNKQIKVQEQRVEELTKVLDKASKKYDENDKELLGWQQALNNAKAELMKMERELRDADRALENVGDAAEDAASPIRSAGRAMDDAAGGAFSLGKALTAGGIIEGGKAAIGMLLDLIDRTKEYRQIQASLEVSSARAGYSAEETAEGYEILFGVLADDQSSATALANLQALKVSQETMKRLINGTVGAWSAYGDSIPIDGLAESINETVQVAKVTGTFADVLNWAGTNEDEFNAKLEACADSSERVELILQELANQGLVDLGEAWQANNRDIVDNNKATNDLNRAYARFAEMAAPAVNSALQTVADGLNNTLDWWEANDEAVKTFIGDMGAAEAATVESTQAMNAALAGFAAEVESLMFASATATAESSALAAESLAALPEQAWTWGWDMISEFGRGVLDRLPSLNEIVEQAAAGVNAVIGFSVPERGPLSDADEYGPDFVDLLSRGIRDNLPELENAVNMAAATMVIQPHVTASPQGGSVSTVNRIDGFTVNVYAAEGQSPQDVAEAVKDMIYAEVARKEAVFGA